jgi:hypothetical protein
MLEDFGDPKKGRDPQFENRWIKGSFQIFPFDPNIILNFRVLKATSLTSPGL